MPFNLDAVQNYGVQEYLIQSKKNVSNDFLNLTNIFKVQYFIAYVARTGNSDIYIYSESESSIFLKTAFSKICTKLNISSFGTSFVRIDHIKQWKMQEMWNPFHMQNYLNSKKFPNFESMSSKNYPFLQMFISFASRNLAVLCVKHPWNGFRFSWKFWCCIPF